MTSVHPVPAPELFSHCKQLQPSDTDHVTCPTFPPSVYLCPAIVKEGRKDEANLTRTNVARDTVGQNLAKPGGPGFLALVPPSKGQAGFPKQHSFSPCGFCPEFLSQPVIVQNCPFILSS